jgi:tetratricopeptide (TPR) repeat protein
LSLYEAYASDFQAAERDARASLEQAPSSAAAYVALAWAQLGQRQLAQVTASYQIVEKSGKLAASDAQAGLGDLALYEGRFADAAQILEKGAADDLAAKYPDRSAARLAALAYTRLSQGKTKEAVAVAQNALERSKTAKIRFLAGRIFAAAGQAASARTWAASLASELQTEPQAYAKLIEGEIVLSSGDSRNAIRAFIDANNLVDTWIGHFDLGRAYFEAGAFTEADSEFDGCIRRRGEALSLFNDEATYGYFPPVYYYLGRVREGLKSSGFAESYRTYLSIRGKAGEDPLLAEVRKHSGL